MDTKSMNRDFPSVEKEVLLANYRSNYRSTGTTAQLPVNYRSSFCDETGARPEQHRNNRYIR